jgi:hypothetical protein
MYVQKLLGIYIGSDCLFRANCIQNIQALYPRPLPTHKGLNTMCTVPNKTLPLPTQ